MKTKTMKRRTIGGVTENNRQERGVHAASTSAPGKPSPLAGAPAGRTVKRAKARAPVRAGRPSPSRPPVEFWQLRLYVLDQTPKSLTAFANLKKFCETHLKGRYRITLIDLAKQPQLAKGDQILAIPTVVRRLPKPVRTIIGTLSTIDHLLIGLDLLPDVSPA